MCSLSKLSIHTRLNTQVAGRAHCSRNNSVVTWQTTTFLQVITITQRAIGIQTHYKISHRVFPRIVMTSALLYNKVLGHKAPKVDTDPIGLISICRVDTDAYHTACGTSLFFIFRIRLKIKAMIHTLQNNVWRYSRVITS